MTDFLRERVREVRDRPTDYWLGGDEREARGALSAAGDFFRNSKVRGTDRPTIGWTREATSAKRERSSKRRSDFFRNSEVRDRPTDL